MTNLEALRKLYKALGGSDENAAALSSNAAAIDGIATLVGAGGGLLPKVTASNNGQVLTVDSGEWKAADLPSGGTE